MPRNLSRNTLHNIANRMAWAVIARLQRGDAGDVQAVLNSLDWSAYSAKERQVIEAEIHRLLSFYGKEPHR